ncbi:MAG: SpoIID/LytB domain-containing protein [Clostridia bacterium]|nr:SpoIID/LytB domain-containing protein [Clostridia bacterium]
MKRFLLLCLIFSLILSAASLTAFADYTLPQYVRIGLMYGNGAVKTVTVESDAGFLLGDYQEREFVKTAETAETCLIVKLDSDGIAVCNESGTLLHSGDSSVGILPNASGMNQVLRVDEVSYRGGIHCIKAESAMTVVNVVFLDHYLYGVISREMSPSWPVEALKAQAVCARNYAAQSLNKHQSQGFDLCSGVDCQAYSGTKAEALGSYAPVDETTRQVLTYDGKLAQLFYSSSMGATTEDVKNVWGNSLPYLISVDNSYEDTENIPNGVWEGYLSCEEATTIMRNKGYDVGDVTDIKVLEYSANQRVVKMEVVGTKGSKVFEREACRTIFNTVTKSQAFTVTGDKGSGAPASVQVTDGTDTVKLIADQLVLLTGEGRETLTGTLCVFDGEETKSYGGSASGSKNKGFQFSGTGWGHSVGMSQYGAKGMAEAGYTYQEILAHYFVGTNLENAY